MQIEYAIFWILFAILLIVLAIFPGITYFGAELIGFISPANMIYLFVIFILMVKVFLMTIELSQLENKVNELIQKIALDEKEEENEKQS